MPHRIGDGSAAPQSVAAGDVTAQLDRILASPEFRHSERLCRFLTFVVTQHLAGNVTSLKQSVVAVEVFDREPSYDSSSDSVVRVEARLMLEGDAVGRVAADLERRLKGMCGLSAVVEVAAPGAVERSMGKARRVIDRR